MQPVVKVVERNARTHVEEVHAPAAGGVLLGEWLHVRHEMRRKQRLLPLLGAAEGRRDDYVGRWLERRYAVEYLAVARDDVRHRRRILGVVRPDVKEDDVRRQDARKAVRQVVVDPHAGDSRLVGSTPARMALVLVVGIGKPNRCALRSAIRAYVVDLVASILEQEVERSSVARRVLSVRPVCDRIAKRQDSQRIGSCRSRLRGKGQGSRDKRGQQRSFLHGFSSPTIS